MAVQQYVWEYVEHLKLLKREMHASSSWTSDFAHAPLQCLALTSNCPYIDAPSDMIFILEQTHV